MKYTAEELFELLNYHSERPWVEAKGAIDNQTYRQMADCDTLKASNELRILKNFEILKARGRGKATYYIAGDTLSTEPSGLNTPPLGLSTPPLGLSTPPLGLITPPPDLSTPPPFTLPEELLLEIASLKQREHDLERIKNIIKKLCIIKPMKSHEIAGLFGKREDYFKRKYLGPMVGTQELKYLHPEMINHPEQAYLTNII